MRIVVGIVEFKNNILFIKRVKEPFKDTLILPGGKVDNGETLDQALEREILEETKSKEPIGYYDEVVYSNGEPTHRHELTIYHVVPISFNYKDSKEGHVLKITIPRIPHRKDEINPSDYRMLERFLIQKQTGFRAKIEVEKLDRGYRILSEQDY